ncbi:MAG: RDD family protein [Verrucomicrobiota bacterium]
MADEPDESIDEPDGIAVRLGRMALGPVRAAAHSGREALTGEAERAIEGMLSGPLPEAVARALVEHHVLERALAEWLEALAADRDQSPERERLARAVEQALASPALERRIGDVAERVVHSEGFRRALSTTLESPEVRSALARQTAGFGAEIGASLRARTRRLDDGAEAVAHRAMGRGPSGSSEYGGVATRGIALALDLVLAHAAFLFVAGSIALIASLAGSLHSGWLAATIGAAAWALVEVAYFVAFWSTVGQTPGMRLMRLRVLAGPSRPPSVRRSLVRFVGLVLAIVVLFLGFVPVLFDRRRRALQDYLAGTAVLVEP